MKADRLPPDRPALKMSFHPGKGGRNRELVGPDLGLTKEKPCAVETAQGLDHSPDRAEHGLLQLGNGLVDGIPLVAVFRHAIAIEGVAHGDVTPQLRFRNFHTVPDCGRSIVDKGRR